MPLLQQENKHKRKQMQIAVNVIHTEIRQVNAKLALSITEATTPPFNAFRVTSRTFRTGWLYTKSRANSVLVTVVKSNGCSVLCHNHLKCTPLLQQHCQEISQTPKQKNIWPSMSNLTLLGSEKMSNNYCKWYCHKQLGSFDTNVEHTLCYCTGCLKYYSVYWH